MSNDAESWLPTLVLAHLYYVRMNGLCRKDIAAIVNGRNSDNNLKMIIRSATKETKIEEENQNFYIKRKTMQIQPIAKKLK